MQYLNWELSVLAKSVAFANLSGAAAQVGISQPQLSRIVSRLEKDLGVRLLDRDAKRKSGWTKEAFRLAEIYSKTMRQFNQDVLQLSNDTQVSHLVVGALDGLLSTGMEFCAHMFELAHIKILDLDLYDLSVLEELFFKGEIDFVFTSREPGRKKYRFVNTIGYQSLDAVSGSKKGPATQVLSRFEYTSKMGGERRAPTEDDGRGKILVSNSLFVRQHWLERFGGSATAPSEVRKRPGANRAGEVPVLLIGSEALPPSVWKHAESFKV